MISRGVPEAWRLWDEYKEKQHWVRLRMSERMEGLPAKETYLWINSSCTTILCRRGGQKEEPSTSLRVSQSKVAQNKLTKPRGTLHVCTQTTADSNMQCRGLLLLWDLHRDRMTAGAPVFFKIQGAEEASLGYSYVLVTSL